MSEQHEQHEQRDMLWRKWMKLQRQGYRPSYEVRYSAPLEELQFAVAVAERHAQQKRTEELTKHLRRNMVALFLLAPEQPGETAEHVKLRKELSARVLRSECPELEAAVPLGHTNTSTSNR